MTDVRQEKLVGAIISLPTFKDENHNLLLDKQRKHIRWLLSQGVAEGNAVLLIAGGYGEGYFMEDDELVEAGMLWHVNYPLSFGLLP